MNNEDLDAGIGAARNSTNDPLFVDLTPGIQSLNQFKTQGYREWWALAEFVDNSITSFVTNREALQKTFGAGYRLQVEIVLDEVRSEIVIVDNAAGIRNEDIGRAFQAGTPPADTSSLSQFGLGLKAAGLWFADLVEVKTRALGESKVKTIRIDLDFINRQNQEKTAIEYEDAIDSLTGTTVRLSALSRNVPVDSKRGGSYQILKEYLQSIYREFLRDAEVQIVIKCIRRNSNNSREILEYVEPEFLYAANPEKPGSSAVLWKKNVDFETLKFKKRIKGWVGLRKNGSYQNTGLVLLWHSKVIIGAGSARDVRDGAESVYKPYVIFGGQNSAASLRIIGELDMSEFISTNRKDDLTWTHEEKEDFEESLKSEMDREPLQVIRMAYRYRTTEKSPDVVDVWKKAVESTVEDVSAATSAIWEDLENSVVEDNLQIQQDLTDADTVEYSFKSDRLESPIRVVLGFGSFERGETYLLEKSSEDDVTRVLINRSSKFAKNHLDPRLTDVGSFLRFVAALAISEIYLRQVRGMSMAGAVRRLANTILNTEQLSSLEEKK